MINVTESFLPPLDEYHALLQDVWKRKWLTNRGPLVLDLEEKLKHYLHVEDILLLTNGTLPLQLAVKSLELEQGEVITTPFSYVATVSSLVWEHAKPVFVDIDPEYFTVDEKLIEAAITPRTKAFFFTHVFGNPCNIDAIAVLAERYKLPVVYDAAHCFGVKWKGESIFRAGTISTCSFHATKVFHTGEGGALFCSDEELRKKLFYMHNFGHNGPLAFHGLGINAKISELQGAMGLSVLPYMQLILEGRKRVTTRYDELLKPAGLQVLKLREGAEWNYSYYPVVFRSEEELLSVEAALKANEIIPRRYFYPSLNSLPYLDYKPMPVSERISRSILCLPLYPSLPDADVERIAGVILRTLNYTV